jgi:hypothetical protein
MLSSRKLLIATAGLHSFEELLDQSALTISINDSCHLLLSVDWLRNHETPDDGSFIGGWIDLTDLYYFAVYRRWNVNRNHVRTENLAIAGSDFQSYHATLPCRVHVVLV